MLVPVGCCIVSADCWNALDAALAIAGKWAGQVMRYVVCRVGCGNDVELLARARAS